MANPLVLIPARMASIRLPGKPLASLCGEPMILHVWKRAMEADIGPVIIATDDDGIMDVVQSAGGYAIKTRADHPSGSDRIYEALLKYDPDKKHDVIVNVQGDLPTIDPAAIQTCAALLSNSAVDIASLCAIITCDNEKSSPDIVKIAGTPVGENILRALYFSRATIPHNEGVLYHHIGLYAYRRSALERFVALPASSLEKREKLEQLRALEDGMRIDVAIVDTVPLGVDTPADLTKAEAMLRKM